MRETLIEFMDSLREYVAESGTNIAHDERDSSEFVDIFLKQGQLLPLDSVSKCYTEKDMDAAYDKGFKDGNQRDLTGSLIEML